MLLQPANCIWLPFLLQIERFLRKELRIVQWVALAAFVMQVLVVLLACALTQAQQNALLENERWAFPLVGDGVTSHCCARPHTLLYQCFCIVCQLLAGLPLARVEPHPLCTIVSIHPGSTLPASCTVRTSTIDDSTHLPAATRKMRSGEGGDHFLQSELHAATVSPYCTVVAMGQL